MITYRVEWPCCGDLTETQAWEPTECPFCTRATAAPVVVGEDTKRLDWLIENHALIETDGVGRWRIHYNWTSPDTYGPWGKDQRAAIDYGMTSALEGD